MFAELQDTQGEGIAPAEVVEQPAIELGGAQCFLDLWDSFRGRRVSVHFRKRQKEDRDEDKK